MFQFRSFHFSSIHSTDQTNERADASLISETREPKLLDDVKKTQLTKRIHLPVFQSIHLLIHL